MSNFSNINGDQRYIFIQTKANNKRKKRIGKKIHKHTLPVRERAMYILITGKIKDYTHPKEVDPFWDTLYRQYEHLVYSELYFRSIVKQYCIDDIKLSASAINVILKTLKAIEVKKFALVTYLTNFMFIMYGSVMKSRFYGWMQYSQKFTSKFNEVTVQLINKLKFDANKTRCSVYYYQAFWLCGLSIIGDIRKQLTTTCPLDVDMDRGTLTIPIHSKGDVKKNIRGTTLETEENPEVFEKLRTLNNISSSNEENRIVDIDETEQDRERKYKSKHTLIEMNDDEKKENPEKLLFEQESIDKQSRSKAIIQDLLTQMDLSIDSLYKSTERSLLKIGRFLKQKIKKGTIDINEEDLAFIKKQYFDGEL